ncbi:ECF transporter S component [Massilioclostridium coli]|uniref:ECF transporter S component n=1 Tax=Massilioclostridium coli TaxID=1870991 RepID=UPI0022E4CF71|nr:ECF transporter S component [Massilioclostridium coli]
MQKITKIIACLLFGVAIFLLGYATVTGMTHNYMLFSFLLAAGICGLFFVSFESRRPALRDIMPVIIICTLASAGRVIFGFLPQVQPVTAIVIITGICYGRQTGFLTGALCALVSNMIMGQGPWTPWQMLAWGIIGWIAGIFGKFSWGKRWIPVLCYGALSGMLFSMITDIWTVASLGMSITAASTWMIFVTGFLFNISHSVGNVIFLLLLYRPMSKKMERMKQKYGVLIS